MMFKSITEKMIKLFKYVQNKAEKIQLKSYDTCCGICYSTDCDGTQCDV